MKQDKSIHQVHPTKWFRRKVVDLILCISGEYNQNLSDRRAISVVNELKSFGIEYTRLKAIGYGETQPIATNDTEEGKAKNRRVTALINQ